MEATCLDILRDELADIDEKLDQFDFHVVEAQINKRVVDEVESKIAELSNALHSITLSIMMVFLRA